MSRLTVCHLWALIFSFLDSNESACYPCYEKYAFLKYWTDAVYWWQGGHGRMGWSRGAQTVALDLNSAALPAAFLLTQFSSPLLIPCYPVLLKRLPGDARISLACSSIEKTKIWDRKTQESEESEEGSNRTQWVKVLDAKSDNLSSIKRSKKRSNSCV